MPKSFYPPEPLTEALKVSKVILKINNGHPMHKLTLAEQLGVTSESRKYRDLITASAGYGLTKGSYKADEISVLPKAKEIIDKNIDSILATLLENPCFKKLHEKYDGASVPPISAARDLLVKECSVPVGQAEAVVRGIESNARAWQLIQHKAGSDKYVPVQMAKEVAEKSPIEVAAPPKATASAVPSTPKPKGESPKPKVEQPPVVPPKNPPSGGQTNPSVHLDIQVHISPDASPAQIEQIFAMMAKHIFNRPTE